MKKRFLAIAITAGLVSSFAANADAKFYGNVHLTMTDTKNTDLTLGSNTSAFGFKGKEDLGGGMSALFKIEYQYDPSTRNANGALTDRDQWVGLKGGMGTVKFGTMTSNYKATGKTVDPFYRTNGEARGLGLQSALHRGAGQDGGRMTKTLQYSSPKMGGMQMVVNTTFTGNGSETTGLGVRYKAKAFTAFFDYLDSGVVNQSAMKVGGSYKMDALVLGFQYEAAEDVTGNDYTFVSANYKLNSNDNIMFTFGDASNADSGYALGYAHALSKKTSTYIAIAEDSATTDLGAITAGLKHKF